jgi:ketosteroid isomerase-like protein
MAEDVTWRWMGVNKWSRTFDGKQVVVDKLFGGAAETLSPLSSVEVRCIHADGDCVVIEHTGRNETPDGGRYDSTGWPGPKTETRKHLLLGLSIRGGLDPRGS